MRILVLEPAAREQRPAAISALMTASLASPFSPLSVMTRLPLEAGRFVGEGAVFVDGVGDARIDAALDQAPAVRHPQFEVLAAVSRRGVDEARARLLRDMVAVEQRNDEAVAERLQRMGADHGGERIAATSPRNS